MWRYGVAGGLIALAVTACSSGSQPPGGAKPTITVTASIGTPHAADYVTRVNVLCAKLMTKVIAVTGGIPPTLERYPVERPQLESLIEAFDAQVEQLEVKENERAAADAFEAFRRFTDAADAELAAAAATGDEDTFRVAYDRYIRKFKNSSVTADLASAGISCAARNVP